MAGPTEDTVKVKVTRDLGLYDVVMLGLGAMIGAGVFVLAGSAARVAGVAAFLGIALAAFVVFLNSLAYAELAGSRPDAVGGGYAWVRETLPPPSGFLSGWLSWAGHLAAAALSAAGIGLFGDYLLDRAGVSFLGLPRDLALGGATYNASENALAAAVFLVFVAAGTLRLPGPARRRPYLPIVKLVLIGAFLIVGAAALLRVPDLGTRFGLPGFAEPLQEIILAAGIFFVAFQGFETIAQTADRVKSPHRTVPLGVFISLGVATAVYLGFYLVVLGNASCPTGTAWECLAAGPRGAGPGLGSLYAATFIAGESGWAVVLLIVAAVFAMASALASNLASASQVSFAMARDGALPAPLAAIHEATRVPRGAQVAGGAVGLLLLVPLSLEELAMVAGILFLLLYSLVNIALIAYRRRQRASARGFRVLLVPVVPALVAVVDVALAIDLFGFPGLAAEVLLPGPLAWYAVLLWLGVGLIYHFFAGGRRAVAAAPAADRIDILAAKEDAFDPARYRVFLPLREFDDPALVEFGAIVAKERGGELSLLHVVEVPRNLPPKAIRFRYVDDRIRGLQRLARVGEKQGVDTRAVVKIGSLVYEIILDTLREEDVNLLVMGWRGERTEGDRRILGSNIDYLIENAPCDVVVFKTRGMKEKIGTIVVLSSPLWSVQGVDELALVLARERGSRILVVSIVEDPAKAEELKADTRGLLERAQSLGVDIEQKIVYSRTYEATALQESAQADLLVVRASPAGPLRRYSLGPIEDRIAKHARVPVLIYRKGTR